MTDPLDTTADALKSKSTKSGADLPPGPGQDASAEALRAWAAEAIRVPPGVTITRVEQFGKTARATVIVYLSDGERITFESMREMMTKAGFETAVLSGIGPRLPTYTLTNIGRIRDALLLAAERHDDLHEEQLMRELGMALLNQMLSRDLQRLTIANRADSRELWRGLVALHAADAAFDHARRNGPPERVRIADHATVIVDAATGDRLLRCADFERYVRKDRDLPDFGRRQLTQLMERVGWKRPKTAEGKLQARRPPGDEHESAVLGAVVWIVPAGWEHAEEEAQR